MMVINTLSCHPKYNLSKFRGCFTGRKRDGGETDTQGQGLDLQGQGPVLVLGLEGQVLVNITGNHML